MLLWVSQADGLAIITACTGHPTLHTISFYNNALGNAAAIEAALDRLAASILGVHLVR